MPRLCPFCLTELTGFPASCPVCGQDAGKPNGPDALAVGSELEGTRQGGLDSQGHPHRFLTGRVIGSGGFGKTYLARDLQAQKIVAVKEYYPQVCNIVRFQGTFLQPDQSKLDLYEEGRKLFLHEATLLNQVQDLQSVVHVSDFFDMFGTSYMVMDYIEGKTLFEMVSERGFANPRQLLQKMLPLIADVQRLHDKNIIHRDINPNNIIQTTYHGEEILRLIDFGCARPMNYGSMTVLVTPGFAPAEQYSKSVPQGPYTDVYGLCATIYYCITTKTPPTALARQAAVRSSQADPLTWPSALGCKIPAEAELILMRGLAIEPQDRVQSMQELLLNLRQVLYAHQGPEKPKTPAISVATTSDIDAECGDEDDGAASAGEVIATHSTAIALACLAVSILFLVFLMLGRS